VESPLDERDGVLLPALFDVVLQNELADLWLYRPDLLQQTLHTFVLRLDGLLEPLKDAELPVLANDIDL